MSAASPEDVACAATSSMARGSRRTLVILRQLPFWQAFVLRIIQLTARTAPAEDQGGVQQHQLHHQASIHKRLLVVRVSTEAYYALFSDQDQEKNGFSGFSLAFCQRKLTLVGMNRVRSAPHRLLLPIMIPEVLHARFRAAHDA
jgi:hypothetical protein